MSIELIDEAANEIGEYSAVAAGLAELKRKYGGIVVDVSSHSALTFAKEVRAEIRAPRYECEKIRKALKAPALQHARLIDTEAAQITAELLAIEAPWDEAIKAVEARRELIRAEAEQAEREQAAKIQARIDALGFDMSLLNKASSLVLAEKTLLSAVEVSLEIFGSRAGEAEQTKQATLSQLDSLYAAAMAREDQYRFLVAQQEALAAAQKKLKDDLAALHQAEQAKIEAEARLVRESAAAEQKILDDAAAVERQRLTDAATAEREFERLAAIEYIATEDAAFVKNQRVRNAANEMLATLKEVLDFERSGLAQMPEPLVNLIEQAINQATGEAA